MRRLTAARTGLAAPPRATSAEPPPRQSFRERGYDARWDRASMAFRRAHPICCGCEAAGAVEPSALTDHVIPHRGDMRLMWDRSNWQACCAWCHNVVKQILERRFEAGELEAADLRLDSKAALALRAAERAAGR